MAISFIGTNTYSSTTASTSFTINKHASTASGDFMVAILALDTFASGGGDTTVTPPTGWTSVGHVHNGNCVIDVMVRTAGGSEPSNWVGTLNQSDQPKASICATYRGASAIDVDNTNSNAGSNTYTISSITNGDADNWSLVQAAYVSATVSGTINSNEATNRSRVEAGTTLEVGAFDSNGTIATGSSSRTVSRSSNWESSCGWRGILLAGSAASTPSAGTAVATGASNAPKGAVRVRPGVIG